ncbi:MAG: FxsA family protein [Myxococcota bacterium]|nr:FxsA family protein [Myxococcota bacterium]
MKPSVYLPQPFSHRLAMCRFVLLVGLGLAAGELVLMLRTAEAIGGLETFCLIILTAAVGLRYARFETASLPMRLQKQKVGITQAALEAALLSFGAFALLIPGFITDGIGILCLFPPTRTLIAYFVYRKVQKRVQYGPTNDLFGQSGVYPFDGFDQNSNEPSTGYQQHTPDDDVIVVQKKSAQDGDQTSP